MNYEVEIERYEVEALDSLHSVIEAMCIAPAIVTRMTVNGGFAMSDSGPLRISNLEVMQRAHGKVLTFGLGLGLIVAPILAKKSVEKLVVVEYLPEIIESVTPVYNDPRLEIVQGDARGWVPPQGEKYDIIYFDIFTERTRRNLPKMEELINRYLPYLNTDNPNAWIKCFYQAELNDLKRAALSLKMEVDSILDWCEKHPNESKLPYPMEGEDESV